MPDPWLASRSRAASDARISRSVRPARRSFSTTETSASALSAIRLADLDEDLTNRAAVKRQHENEPLGREAH